MPWTFQDSICYPMLTFARTTPRRRRPRRAAAALLESLESRRLFADVSVFGNARAIAPSDFTPSPLDHTDFGNVVSAGNAKVTRTFTIANTGSAPVMINPVTIGGPDRLDFAIVQQPGSIILSPGDNRPLVVEYNPTAAGIRSATVDFMTNGTSALYYTFGIMGTADMVGGDVASGGLNTYRYRVVNSGDASARAAQSGDALTVNYTGRLADNATVFDSSKDPGDVPFAFALGGNVIPGWNFGLVGARPGETRQLVISPEYAYGAAQQGPLIAPNSTLIFDVDVLSVSPPDLDISYGNVPVAGGETPSAAKGTDFGTVAVAGDATKASDFSFISAVGLARISNVTITGVNASDFSVAPVAGGMRVTFNPSAAGLRSATVNVFSNDPDESPFAIPVRGIGAAATVSVAGPVAPVREGTDSRASFTLTLSEPAAFPVTVQYATDGASVATENADYLRAAGSVTFEPGQTIVVVDVLLLDDAAVEPDETVTLKLTAASGALLPASPSAQATILDNDAAITVSDVVVTRPPAGATANAVFVVTLSNAVSHPIALTYRADALTATPGVDFTPLAGQLVFNAGDVVKTISVPVYGSFAWDASESFALRLSDASAATISRDSALATILAAPLVTVANASAREGSPGSANRQLVFPITLAQPAASDVTLSYDLAAGGTASEGADFLSPRGTVTIPAGQTAAEIRVSLVGDGEIEPDETVVLTVTSADTTGPLAGLAPFQITGTIVDDDRADLAPVSVTYSAARLRAGARGGAVVRVSASNPQPETFSNFAVVDLYLSQDDTFDGAADIRLNGVRKPVRLKPSATGAFTLPIKFTLPAALAAGQYRLLAVVDPAAQLPEGDETNNVVASAVTFDIGTPAVDLQVFPSSKAPKGLAPAQPTKVAVSLLNAGPSTFSGSVALKLFASPGSALDADATPLGVIGKVATLKPQKRTTAVFTVTLPASLAAGTFHLIATVDPDNAVTESNDSNNTAASAWTFTV